MSGQTMLHGLRGGISRRNLRYMPCSFVRRFQSTASPAARPDFKCDELHVQYPVRDRTASYSSAYFIKIMYFVEGELCIMNRNLSERMDGTLARIVKSVEKKTRRVKKQKMKTLKPKDPHGYTLAVGVPPPQETPLGRYSLEMPGAKVKSNNLSNDDFKTGMIVSFDKYKYKVIVNAPVITSLSTFPKKGCYVGSPIVPSVFSTYADYARYLWFCERPGEGYVYVSDAECYVPTSCESDCRLKVYVTPCRLGDDGEEIVGRSVALCLPEPVRTPACSPAITDHRSEFTNYAHRSSEINREDRSTEGKMSMDINSMLQYRLGKGCEENEEIQSASTTSLQRGENELRVVSYNVLADAYASQPSAAVYIFPYVDPACLRLNHRVQLVLHELLAYDADVICLQECDMLAYKDFFEPIFRHLGYEGIYTNKDAVVLEGCAMFVRKETLTIVQKVNLSMKEILQDAPHLESVYELRPDLRGVLGDRVGTVAQLALCRDPRSGEKVIVTNTHLYFHPKADFVRVLQADAICQAVERLRKDSQDSDGDGNDENVWKRNAEGDVGVIMCGDLNSNPQSAVIEYLNRGGLTASHPVWASVNGFAWRKRQHSTNVNSSSDSRDGSEESAEDPNADLTGAEEGDRDGDGDREQNPRGKSPTDEEKGTEEAADTVNINGGTYAVVPIGISTPSLQHSLNLDSAAGYPVYTNYVEGFQDCLDYIHISSQHFRTVRVAPFPPVDVLSAHTALPSPAFPSDHLAVVVDLQYKKQGGEEITK